MPPPIQPLDLKLDRTELDSISSRAKAVTNVLRLPLHQQIWRGQTGDFAGSGTGSSLDFQDHRAYTPGDDPRHINWQAYARTGNYSMKLYREEVRPLVDLVFDVSNSMFFEENKRRRSLDLFYFVIHAVQRAGASLTSFIVKGREHEHIAADALHAHAWVDRALALPESGNISGSNPASSVPPALDAIPLRAQSMRVFISDLLFEAQPAALLSRLSERKGRAIVFAPFTPGESHPDWFGNYEFIDAETLTNHPHRLEPPALNRYRQAYHNHFELWKHQSRRFDVRLARVPSDLPFMPALRSEALPTQTVGLWT